MAIQWFTTSKRVCDCEADVTQVSTVREVIRGMPPRRIRSRMVRHWRERDDAHFWHWEIPGTIDAVDFPNTTE